MSATRKDLITLLDFGADDIEHLITDAIALKKTRLIADPDVMRGRTGILIFEKQSLRTRVSFETAINELGGHAINLASEMVAMGKRESIADVARNLQRWVHLVVFRTHSHARLVELAANCDIPIINALTDSYHPCQALALGMTLRQRLGARLSGRVVFIGDGNNVCSSIMEMCCLQGHSFTLACPQGYEPSAEFVRTCAEVGAKRNCTVEIVNDPVAAVAKAAVVYTDVWASMGQEKDAERRARDLRSYQVNAALLKHAPAGVLVSHCLPAHRGEEITDEVLDSERCVALDEAENRLHVQKSAIRFLLR
jgi:ornithine carbamoyltransferase